MLNVTYNRIVDPDVTVTTAAIHLPFYGRWCRLDITSYCLGGGVSITFGLTKSDIRDIQHRGDASPTGAIGLSRGNNGNRQDFEQEIVSPFLVGQLFEWSQLGGGGVIAARTVVVSVTERTESIVESVRQSIRRNMSAGVRNEVLDKLNDLYGTKTYQAIRTFLGEINWRLMLEGSELDDDAFGVFDVTFADPILVHRITSDDDTGIPLIANAELKRFDRTTLANIKATTLLRKVCGDKLGDKFDKTGHIIIWEHDYRFVITPNQFVECTDPNGKTARLCIHTKRFSCNPIDEAIISYLHIRNRFEEWMAMAVVHSAQSGFQRNRHLLEVVV